MATISVDGSAARLLANGVLAKSGYCLYYCWLAISQGVVHYITGGAGNAYSTWLAVPADHQHASRVVPKDFPAFLGKKFSSSAGDVIISRGDGTFVATDWPGSKRVGVCTLAERETQTGRKFVGWASSMGGHELVSTSTAGESGTPITPEPIKINRRKRKNMTDSILWYVNKASTDTTIKAGTAWFQRTPGAAVVQLDGNGVVGQSSEYTALLNLNYRMNDGTPGANDNPEALRNFYTPINGDDLLKLIAVRGLVPVYDAAGAVSNGQPITDGAAILAAIKAIPAPPTKATVTLS